MNSDNIFLAARAPPLGAFLLQFSKRNEVKSIAKKENVVSFTVPFSSDKFAALTVYANNRGEKVEEYMAKSLEGWYRKKVPSGVREYLDAKYELEFGKPPGPLNISAVEPEGSTEAPAWES